MPIRKDNFPIFALEPTFLYQTATLEILKIYLLPLIYALFFGWVFQRSTFFNKAGLPRWFVLAFLAGKIITGLFYTWIMLKFIPSATKDIELFFGGGLKIYQAFWNDPAAFPSYLAEIFRITDFRIGHTDSDFIRTVFDGIKFIHFLLNFLSGGALFTNVLLYNCLSTWLFLRCWVYLKSIFGHPWLGAWLFLFPSAFFFTSVILKEGIELTLIAAIIPLLYRLSQKKSFLNSLVLLLLFALLFFFKYLIGATFSAALVLYLLYKKYPRRKKLITVMAISSFIVLFFIVGQIHPALNLPQYIIDRRVEFQGLEANSALNMRPLEPTMLSFARALPEALQNVLLKPLPGEGGKLTYLVFSDEIIVFWILVFFLMWHKKPVGNNGAGPEAWAFLLFAIINLLIIGYTITNIGAITRYRSIFIPGIGYFCWMLFGGGEAVKKIMKGYKSGKIKLLI